MTHVDDLLHAEFAAAATSAAALRSDVDPDVARELMDEAATMLHNSLALDALSAADLSVVVPMLAADLVAVDPGAALRARAASVREGSSGLAEPEVAGETFLVCAAVLMV